MRLRQTKKNKSKRLVNKKYKMKRGGTKKIYSNVSRSSAINTGNNLRQLLVNLCKQNDMEAYDKVTQQIMREYWDANRDNNNSSRSIDFFTHLKNNYDTFSINTKLCLERCLTQLQEDAIPESMYYLSDIIQLKQSLK
jgi:hypothetical protein